MIINGNLYLAGSSIESLGNLKEVNGSINFWSCINLKDLGNLQKAKSISLRNCPNLKSFPKNLKLEVIYGFDNDFEILSNWKGFQDLKELVLTQNFIIKKLDFLNIPKFIEPYLDKISFGDIIGMTKNLSNLNFKEIPKDYKHYNFLINQLFIVFDKNNSLFPHRRSILVRRVHNGLEISWEENWGGKNSVYSEYSELVKILCDIDFINYNIDYFLDASGLVQNERDLKEDEDPKNYGHEYSVRNVKFETLKDILKIRTSGDLIKLGEKMGIRYDY